MLKTIFLALLFSLVFGCSGNEADEPTKPNQVLETQMKALESARGVEQQIEDAAQRQREAIEAQER